MKNFARMIRSLFAEQTAWDIATKEAKRAQALSVQHSAIAEAHAASAVMYARRAGRLQHFLSTNELVIPMTTDANFGFEDVSPFDTVEVKP